MLQVHKSIRKRLLFITISLLCMHKISSMQYHPLETSRSEIEGKTNTPRERVAPIPRVPIITCTQAPKSWVGPTLMFLSYAFQKTGPCIKCEITKYEQPFNKILQDFLSQQCPNAVIGIIREYSGMLIPQERYEELNGKKTNSWFLFEQYIGQAALSSPENYNPQDFYDICIQQEHYSFSTKWLQNATQKIIQMKLRDLQKMALLKIAHNPYAFTLNRVPVESSHTCTHCKTKLEPQLKPEHHSWLEDEQSIQHSIHSLNTLLEVPKKTIMPCASCNKPFEIMYIRELGNPPQLLIRLLNKKIATLSKITTIGQYKCKLVGELGYDKHGRLLVSFHDKRLQYHLSQVSSGYLDYTNQEDIIRATAGLYQLRKERRNVASGRAAFCSNCIIL